MLVSIFKRPGRANWYIRYSKDIGLPIRCLDTPDKAKAQFIRNQEHDKYVLGKFNINETLYSPLDISTAAQMFIDSKRTYGREPNTIEAYKHALNNFLKFLGSNIVTHAVAQSNIDAFINKRTGAGVSKKTVRNELVILKGFFKYARKKKIIQTDPTEDIPLPRRPKTLKRAFKRNEYKLFKQTISLIRRTYFDDKNPDRKHTRIVFNPDLFNAIVDFYILTGIRREDGTLIRISDHLDLKRKILVIPDAKKNTTTKTVYLHPRLMRTVKTLLHYQQNDQLIPLYSDTLTKWFRMVRDKAGLDETLTFHSFRHTFATWLAEAGADPRSIMDLLGHSTLEPTLIYMHAVEAKRNKAMRLIKLPQVGQK